MASDAENVSIWWRHHAPCWALFNGRIINQVMCYSHEDKYNLTNWSPWARGVSIRHVTPGDQCVKYLRYNVIRSFQDVVLVIQDHYRSLICYMMVMDGWYIPPSINDGWVMDIPSINQQTEVLTALWFVPLSRYSSDWGNRCLLVMDTHGLSGVCW